MKKRSFLVQWFTHRTLLSVGFVLSTMTQLRWPGFPVGPGEFLLTLYVLWVMARLLNSNASGMASSAGRAVIWYWMTSLLILAIGFGIGYWEGVTNWVHARHDTIAYVFVATVCVCIALDVLSSEQASKEILRITVTAFAICGSIWVYALCVPYVGEMRFWYGGVGVRYMGLSVNPNQNALLLIGAPFMLLFYLEQVETSWRDVRGGFFMLFGALTVAAGWGTGSAALRITWLALIPSIIILAVFYTPRSKVSRDTLVYFYITMALAASLTYLSTWLIPWIMGLYDAAGMGVKNSDLLFMTADSELQVRLALWHNAWQAMERSPVFGLGPGAFSGLAAPFGGSEAHNSLVDWMTNAGLLGGALLFAAVSSLFWRCIKKRSIGLLTLMSALALFGIAHHVLRHPLVGVLLVLMAMAASPTPESPPPQ